MTAERLGVAPDGLVPVWVLWADAGTLLEAVARLVPFACPECGAAVDLARPRGVLACVAETKGCVSASDQCPACRSRLHFDATPPERRAKLWWPQVALGAPLSPPGIRQKG